MTPEELQIVKGMIDQAIDEHFHTGTRSGGKRLNGKNLLKAPQSGLTTKNTSIANSGDATTDAIINNNRTRIGEIETALQNLGLLN